MLTLNIGRKSGRQFLVLMAIVKDCDSNLVLGKNDVRSASALQNIFYLLFKLIRYCWAAIVAGQFGVRGFNPFSD